MKFRINKNKIDELELNNLPKCIKYRIDDGGILVIIVDMECFKKLKKEKQEEIENKFDILIQKEKDIEYDDFDDIGF